MECERCVNSTCVRGNSDVDNITTGGSWKQRGYFQDS